MVAATFGDRNTSFAQRAFFWFVGRYGEMEQWEYFFLRYTEVGFAAASIYQKADAYNVAFGFIDYIDNFFDRAAGGNDIFYDEDFFTRSYFKATAKCHFAIFSFGENGTNAQKTSGDLRENDAPSSGSDDGFDAFIFEMVCKFFAKFFSVFRMLEYIEFFYIPWAVKSAGQKEVAFHDSIGFFQ